jgi:hypothetical protein
MGIALSSHNRLWGSPRGLDTSLERGLRRTATARERFAAFKHFHEHDAFIKRTRQ